MRLLLLIGIVVIWQGTISNAGPLKIAIRCVNDFSNRFVKAIAEDSSTNLVCSPVSVHLALSMLAFGARGNTERVLRPAVGIGSGYSALPVFRSLIDSLDESSGFELRMANTIFLDDGSKLTRNFAQITDTYFRSPAQIVNFSNPIDATNTINRWVENRTNNRIKNLIGAEQLKPPLVLVNAIHFKANWEYHFDGFRTEARPFYVNGTTVKNVTRMFSIAEYKCGELPDVNADFVEIPYRSSNFSNGASMFIVLPRAIDGLSELLRNFDKVTVARLQGGTIRQMLLLLPKFKIESKIDLRKDLTKLGLGEIFSDAADFSGVIDSPLKVSEVVQKAFIEVTEKGTEAAVVTESQLSLRMAVFNRFNVSHPFVAVIATNSGIPIFTSVVTDPIY